MLASAGCVSTAPLAQTVYRPDTTPPPPAHREPTTPAVHVSDVRSEPTTLVEHVYVEGTLVDLADLAELPVRQVSFEDLSQGWGPEPISCSSCGALDSTCLGGLHQHCRAAWGSCVGGGGELLAETCLDYQDFYSLRGLTILGVQVGAAAVLANTSLDRDFQDWHDNSVICWGPRVRSRAVARAGNRWTTATRSAAMRSLGQPPFLTPRE